MSAYRDPDFWKLCALAGGVVVFVLYMGVLLVVHAATYQECLRRGWRDSNVTVLYERYCITRNDQTDIVKPLRDAEPR